MKKNNFLNKLVDAINARETIICITIRSGPITQPWRNVKEDFPQSVINLSKLTSSTFFNNLLQLESLFQNLNKKIKICLMH